MDLKNEHSDCLLFFRLGDFYEVFYDDAKVAHQVLGITLTARNKNAPNPIPMAWIPHHALQKYIPSLIEKWYKVALAEQIWIPQPGKIVERKVVEIITPGTYIGSNTAELHVLAIIQHKETYQLAWGDFSIGKYKTKTLSWKIDLVNFVAGLDPVEVILDERFSSCEDIEGIVDKHCRVSKHSVPFDVHKFLKVQLWVAQLWGYWKALEAWRDEAVSLLFSYLTSTQKRDLWSVHSLQGDSQDGDIHIDTITLKNLEVFQSSYEGSKEHSLYGVMNTCATAMWSRLLKRRLLKPCSDEQSIATRRSWCEHYIKHLEDAKEVQHLLKHFLDIPRLLTSIMYKKPSSLKIQNLKNILESIVTNEFFSRSIIEQWWYTDSLWKELSMISNRITETIVDANIQDSKDFIKIWFDKEVDRLRQVADHSDDLLLKYQQFLSSTSWVTNVKVVFVRNQWYSIQITPKDKELFETIFDADKKNLDFIRTQSLKGGQRYTSSYLTQLQENILSASEKLAIVEHEILIQLISEIEHAANCLFELWECLARLDLSSSHAIFVQKKNRSVPTLSEGKDIKIISWRHPVIEEYLPHTDHFIPNDLVISDKNYFHLITGPNMWWKSTYLRQNALIVLLSHAWLCVPADQATISIVDGIFARVWSWDALAKNQSTFMTEMIEMANILHHATKDSFVVLDELGRWTSTYDWLALAKAISVYMCQKLYVPTLFATHYHELTSLEGSLDWFSNWHVDVKDTSEQVVFLKKIVQWWASKSYGIDVAKLAWIPSDVIKNAWLELRDLESWRVGWELKQLSFFEEKTNENSFPENQKIIDTLAALDLHSLTPLELMQKIDEIQQKLAK